MNKDNEEEFAAGQEAGDMGDAAGNSDDLDMTEIGWRELDAHLFSVCQTSKTWTVLGSWPDACLTVYDSTQEVDFEYESGIADLSNKVYVVIVIRHLLRTLEPLGLGLCRMNGQILCFLGSHWHTVGPEDLSPFLGEVARRMSVPHITAEFHGFRADLVRQFYAVATFPSPEPLDDRVLVNLLNGTLEVTSASRALRSFDPDDFLTYQLQFGYDPEAEAPKWHTFLDRVLPDPDSQVVLAEALGWAFTSLKLEKVVMLLGTGANGKSVVFDVIQALLGPENVTNYSLKNLDRAYYRAKIANKIINFCSEASTNMDPDEFKKLASGEPIDARNPYGEPYIVRRYAKLFFNSNELPPEVEHTKAFFRRFLIIPFDITIPLEEQNPDLAKEIICAELPGVLNWILVGLDRLIVSRSFSKCDAVENAVEAYRLESNSVALFVNEYRYVPSIDEKDRVKLVDLQENYRSFCIENGFKAVNVRNLRKRLTALAFESRKLNIGVVVFATRVRNEVAEAESPSEPIIF